MKRRNNVRRHLRFPILMLLALLCSMPAVLAASRHSTLPPETAVVEPEVPETENQDTAGTGGETAAPPEQPEPSQPETPDEPETAEPETPQQPLSAEALFSTCLFIGDSRTVGLMEYGGMNGATFFSSVGMTAFSVFDTTVKVSGYGETTLEALLQSRQFERIHLMLGINELGYDLDAAAKRYAQVLEKIQALQPEATIYLGANLHVDADRSARDAIYNNDRLNTLNDKIAALADGEQVIYLDVNQLFDDATGALRSDLTGDGTHVYGSVYQDWSRWLVDAMQ